MGDKVARWQIRGVALWQRLGKKPTRQSSPTDLRRIKRALVDPVLLSFLRRKR
ncbi:MULTISPECIES: hypothetical protein [Acidovorax]|uniref:hypothetical protein n=1 Tax=Acidovorax TaxID=12916 RepID=UPI001356495D|nr:MULTISPECIES: hypothetical protein [Acidovorax]